MLAAIEQKRKALARMQLAARVKEDLKTVALGTSKINYLDPRITVAWCKLNEVRALAQPLLRTHCLPFRLCTAPALPCYHILHCSHAPWCSPTCRTRLHAQALGVCQACVCAPSQGQPV